MMSRISISASIGSKCFYLAVKSLQEQGLVCLFCEEIKLTFTVFHVLVGMLLTLRNKSKRLNLQ